MPPKRGKLSGIKLRELSHENGIRLRGHVLPTQWPTAHKHHFLAIRRIGDLHYDLYKEDELVSSQQRKYCTDVAQYLRDKVAVLLNDIGTNESTWRQLEEPIFKRFDGKVIW
jgi:hypothetical protein